MFKRFWRRERVLQSRPATPAPEKERDRFAFEALFGPLVAERAERKGRSNEAQNQTSVLQNEVQEKFAVTNFEMQSKLAAKAEARFDYRLAREIWSRLRTEFAGNVEGYDGESRSCMPIEDVQAALDIALVGLARFPGDRRLHATAARASARLRLWKEAEAQWDRVLELVPNDSMLAVEAARSLIGPPAGRLGRLRSVARRLEAVQERFPESAEAAAAYVNALHDLDLQAAAKAGRAAHLRFPADVDVVVSYAKVLEAGENFKVGIELLEEARTLRRDVSVDLELAYSHILELAGAHDQALRVCTAALELFQNDARLIAWHIALAFRSGDDILTRERAKFWADRFPHREGIQRTARRFIDMTEQNETGRQQVSGTSSNDAEMYMRFESLGGTSGACEFGFIQRRYGAEPVGLLRWASMGIDGLILALEKRFTDLSDPDYTQIVIQKLGKGQTEYFISDSRYQYWAHTFISVDEAPEDKVYKQALRRIRFLRDKLIEDLESGDKIFVFKAADAFPLDRLPALHDAICSYHQAALLCMMLADADHSPGSVDVVRTDLFIGRVANFGNDVASWHKACVHVANYIAHNKAA